jgi:hypothetical protein
MSNIQYAFIDRDRVPDRVALQASIDGLGFDLKLHPEYTTFRDHGFLPFVLNGEQGTGFDIEYQEAGELLDELGTLRDVAANRSYCISMAWHGSMRDLACAMIFSYTLAKEFGAVVSFEGNAPEPIEALLLGVREALEEAKRERDQPSSRLSHSKSENIKKPWWKLW